MQLYIDQDGGGGANIQLCIGQEGCAEANIHSMRSIFQEEDTYGINQVDKNAFNTIN